MKIKLLFPGGPLLALLWMLFLLPLISNAQEKNSIVRGTVRGINNQPVAGASVIIKGSQIGTTTNQQGEFSINAPGNATLVITALDYETGEMMVNNRSAISISLKQAERSLGEVVVIGYGTQKKKDITGSVARVNLETMKNSPN